MGNFPQIDDSRFHAWARRLNQPIKEGTPYGQVLELFLRWIYELGDEQRTKEVAGRRDHAEKKAMLDRATERFPGTSRPVRRETDDLVAGVSAGWTRGRPELRAEAYDAVNHAAPLTRWLYHSHGADVPVDRWTYMRHFFIALNALGGRQLDPDELLALVVEQERLYLEAERKAAEVAARARRPGLQRDALLRWARKLPMNPVDEFEPGIAFYDVESAGARKDFMDSGGLIEIDGYNVTVTYDDDKSLSFSSKILDFKAEDMKTAAAAFVRRHRKSGRLVVFVVHEPGAPVYKDLPEIDALTREDRMYLGVPYLLTPLIHARFTQDPLYDVALGILGVLKIMSLGKGLPVGARIVSAGLTTTARVGTGLFTAGRSAAAEVSFAVGRWGWMGAQTAQYVGRSAWTYYLTNGVAINTHVVVGSEIALSFAGQDMGPLSLGDSLVMASQIDDAVRAGRRTWQELTVTVEAIEDAGNVARLRVTKAEEIGEAVAKREYDLGKTVKAGKPGATKTARAVDDTATRAKGITAPRLPVVPPGAVALGKRKVNVPSGALGPPVLLEELNKAKATMVANLGRFPSLQKKYTPAALDTIRGISADAIRAAGIRPQDLANLANGLSRAGSTVGAFVNDYHAVPGFEQVLLNWAKRAYWRAKGKNPAWVSSKASYTGATYVMKYVTGKNLPAAALRFEWPVSINDTRFGTEVTARWVDIVLSGGDKLRPGVTIQLELKSWTEAMLRIKTRFPAGQSTTYPGTVGYQLIRDTALFRPENIRWVFDSRNGLTKAQVIRAFERVIANDVYLASQWGGKDRSSRLIRDLLNKVIEVF